MFEDSEAYFVEMEPNMIKGVALYKTEFLPGGQVYYSFIDNTSGDVVDISEDSWAILNHDRLVPVQESIVDVWTEKNPMDYTDITRYVV